MLSPAIRPACAGRIRFTVYIDAFRIRAAYQTLVRLVSPLFVNPKWYSSRTARLYSKTLNKAITFDPDIVTVVQPVDSHPLDVSLLDSNVVPLRPSGQIYLEALLDRLCIPVENFHFIELRRDAEAADISAITAKIDDCYVKSSSGLDMDAVGRELGQLGLVAVCASNERPGAFYVPTEASMVYLDHSKMKSGFLQGKVSVRQIGDGSAQAEIELSSRKNLVCKMRVEYDILSSWTEVLPSLNKLSSI